MLFRSKADLETKGLLKYVPDYVNASGKLALSLYKAEIEASLRTPHMGGFQLLGLQDFSGQSTATIGLLDVFFKTKGLVTPEGFRSFCSDLVPLVELPKFSYQKGEAVALKWYVSNFTGKVLEDVTLGLRITNSSGICIVHHTIEVAQIPVGLYEGEHCKFEDVLNEIKGREKLTFSLTIEGYDCHNEWPIWAYEALGVKDQSTTVVEKLTPEVIHRLQGGESIILCPKEEGLKNKGPSTYFPVFWSPVHFESEDPCGMVIRNQHPLFAKYYKTTDHADLEWKPFLENSYCLQVDALAQIEPLTLAVPNFYHNHKFTHLLEAKVGKGKVLICTYPLGKDSERPLALQYFEAALQDYVSSADFDPVGTLEIEALMNLVAYEEAL